MGRIVLLLLCIFGHLCCSTTGSMADKSSYMGDDPPWRCATQLESCGGYSEGPGYRTGCLLYLYNRMEEEPQIQVLDPLEDYVCPRDPRLRRQNLEGLTLRSYRCCLSIQCCNWTSGRTSEEYDRCTNNVQKRQEAMLNHIGRLPEQVHVICPSDEKNRLGFVLDIPTSQ
jgi:hypothetical protein